MTTVELYCKGGRIWVPNSEHVWEGGVVAEGYKNGATALRVTLESGKVVELSLTKGSELPPLRNPDILVGENDLTSLSYLHEPAVLYNLQVRFCRQNAIYTYCGIVLVAINPYSELPIYGGDTVWAYRGKAMGDLDPHIFAVAEEAYTKLEREQRDQSIIVSGESGAGKTVSAKYAMRYFATVGGSSTETQVEKKVLASSPIMEAIGNAKTTRNDNSSRFGKYIEIHFDNSYHILGASMRTYLLEKSRVVFQAPDERNYHIFYQLCATRDQFPELRLDEPNLFAYLKQGGSSAIDGVNDRDTFQEMLNALTLLGFGAREQSDMWKVLASILHLGNVRFSPEAEGSTVNPRDPHLLTFCDLLSLEPSDMRTWLVQRRIVSVRESLNKPMNVKEAIAARDALAKHMYAELFAWIVTVVNKALESVIGRKRKFIGVLDIYGFETFDINSFEQFCINYANEKLQQQFNQHVFKLEQEEYLREEIEWKFIDFHDNQPCIDLIETKLGILDLLDEECRMPKGEDRSWASKLYKQCTKWPHFSKPRFGDSSFCIQHFADTVQYEVNGFLEKNRDTVMQEQLNVLRSAQNKLVQRLFTDESQRLSVTVSRVKIQSAPVPIQNKMNKKTVGSQFRDSLNMLMATLNATTPHYIRCIKPNDGKKPFDYNPIRAVQQLRACGVLETIRISAAGFPSRWTYVDFFTRYRVLCHSKDINYESLRATCEGILKKFIKDEDKYQFGKTKLFFRAGQVAYLEKIRGERLRRCCVLIQSSVRMFICRRKYLRKHHAILTIQRYTRGHLARRLAKRMREERAAIMIQKTVRGWLKKTQYRRLKRSILGIQTHARGLLARKRFLEMRYRKAAITIQKNVRAWLCRKRYLKTIRKIVVVQSAVRRFLARRKFRALKREARSVEHVKKLNKGLENKIISLQQRIEELVKDNNNLKSVQSDLSDLKVKYEGLRGMQVQLKRTLAALAERDRQVERLNEELKHEQALKVDLANDMQRIETERKTVEQDLNNNIIKLTEELNAAQEQIKQNQAHAEEILNDRLEQEKLTLMREQDQDRIAYQNLLRDFHELEMRSENMEKELARIHREGGKIPATLRKKQQQQHLRTPSSASTMSAQDDTSSTYSELPDDSSTDYGYGSVHIKSSTTPHPPLDSIDWNRSQSSQNKMIPEVDVGLVLKLQARLNDVQKEKERLFTQLDALEKNVNELSDATVRTQDSFREPSEDEMIQELEVENQRLHKDLDAMRRKVSGGDSQSQTVLNQLSALESELVRRREECIELRSILANQTSSMKNVASFNYSRDVDFINEDGELTLAFETQKSINRQLESELQREKDRHNAEKAGLVNDIEQLRADNERMKDILTQNLNEDTSQAELYLKHEVSRLTSENLDLQEKYDAAVEQNRQYRSELKNFNRKFKEMGDSGFGKPIEPKSARSQDGTKCGTALKTSEVGAGDYALQNQAPQPAPRGQGEMTRTEKPPLPVVRKKDREYRGMFEFKKGDEQAIMARLVFEFHPADAVKLLPSLPAYIMIMCVRHTDHIYDEDLVRFLLTSFITSVKKLVRSKKDDLEVLVLWLANVLRLLHNMKQYSGDKDFQEQNTPRQNEQCFRNFDLTDYRTVLSDVAVTIYQALIAQLEDRINHLIIPAILEYEAISGLSSKGGVPTGLRGRAMSDAEMKPRIPESLDALLAELSLFRKILVKHAVDRPVIIQVFRQLFYYICATSVNNLLLRKDLCNWSKGMQIRFNLSHLEQWSRDMEFPNSVANVLSPIIEAAQLLQARKSEGDVEMICDMCGSLTAQQIIKILNLYTPVQDYEERVPTRFVTLIQNHLKARPKVAGQADKQEQVSLLMDVKSPFPVRFDYQPSPIRLEDIEIPSSLNLPELKKV